MEDSKTILADFEYNYDGEGALERFIENYDDWLVEHNLDDAYNPFEDLELVAERISIFNEDLERVEHLLNDNFELGEMTKTDFQAYLAGRGYTYDYLKTLTQASLQNLFQEFDSVWEENTVKALFHGIMDSEINLHNVA